MVDLLSTPILVTIILGVVGLAIPAIDAGRREKGPGRNKAYSGIAFGALIVAMGIIIFRVFSGEVLPAVAFSQEVLVDDLFGSFFAIALLLVSIMVTLCKACKGISRKGHQLPRDKEHHKVGRVGDNHHANARQQD